MAWIESGELPKRADPVTGSTEEEHIEYYCVLEQGSLSVEEGWQLNKRVRVDGDQAQEEVGGYIRQLR